MKTNRIIQLAAGVLLLTACTSDFYEEYVNGRVPVNLGYEVLTAEESTRTAASTTLNDANIASGDAITVKIKDYNTAVGNYTNYTYTAGDGGAMTPPSPKPYYPTGSTNIDILAYYPANAASNFDVAADQTTDDNYKASDLMVATVTNQAKTTSTVALAFQHKMAKLVVTATKGDGVNTIQTITLKNVKRRVIFTNTTGEVGTATSISGTDVTLFKSGTGTSGTGAALIPAQTIEGNVIEIVTDQGTAVYNVPAGKTFTANTKYTITVTVNRTAVGAVNSITWGSSASLTIQPTVEVTKNQYPLGLPGLFSVSATKKVCFSQGNLQYDGTNWKFATNQYDVLGANGTGANGTATGYPMDLFTWGNLNTAPTYNGKTCYFENADLSGSTDWGSNAISNGGNAANSGWFTLSRDEWRYLFNTRTNAASKYGYATVAGKEGIIIVPDDFTDPMKNNDSGAFVGSTTTGFGANVYTEGDNWNAMESAGCVFLPAAGERYGASVTVVGSGGRYWSSTSYDEGHALYVRFGSGGVDPLNREYGIRGFSVRLVRPAWYKEMSSATSSDIGKIICSNGHIHTNVSDVTCGGTASGMLAYVGSSTDNSNYTHGLVIALSDANSTSANWSTQNDKCNSYSTARPSASSSWAMPSKSQWEQMIAASSYANLRDMKGNQSSACGGTAMQSDFYWSSTVYSGSDYWGVNLSNGDWFPNGAGCYARAVFAF